MFSVPPGPMRAPAEPGRSAALKGVTYVFEYHGWAVVRDDTYSTDDRRVMGIADELRNHLARHGDGSGLIDIRWVNGACLVTFAGCPNHSTPIILELLPWLAERAPGSYGLLYVWDDEDREWSNEFRVWTLCRGDVVQRQDSFLSPIVPMLEDPYDPTRPP